MKTAPQRVASVAFVVSLLAQAACGPSQDSTVPVTTSGSAASSIPSGIATSPPLVADKSVPPVLWANPGGMWMPDQIPAQADTLKKLGFQLDATAFSRPTEFPLGAVVSLGGCSASFVSPDGLIITNHHCVIGALQYNATEKQDLLKDGFLAHSRGEEKSNGPASRVFVTTKFTDVTQKIRDGLEKMKDDAARYQAVEDRTKGLVADCEKGKQGVKCSVATFFGGAQYTLVEQLEIRDVRLVYAPPEGIGNYGGETDNWRWPRHAGDFGFFRAYVGKDGSPADYSADNVPFKPAHYLKIAADALEPGDPVMVAGYPARTNRITTAAETKEAVSWEYPHTIAFTQAYLDELDVVKKVDKSLEIKAETFIRGLANWQTNVKGKVDGLVKDGLAAKKDQEEADLDKWIDADPARKKKFGGGLAKMDKLEADHDKTREGDAILREPMRMSRMLSAAYSIVRNAEEREKPDAQRDPNYQDRNQKRLVDGSTQITKVYDPRLDAAMVALAVERELALATADRVGLADAVVGKPKKAGQAPSGDAIQAASAALFAKTKLGDEAVRTKLLQSAKLADLKKSDDPLIQLALTLRPKLKAADDRDKALTGGMANLRPTFVEALREKRGGNLAPDANSTLRVTYGTVRGYAPAPDKAVYYPFSALSEMVAKNKGAGEFNAPQAAIDAFNAKKFGAYVDKKLAEVPVDFLSDLDITGGNSGSPTLNAKGDLVGLAFDGNYESMASDWLFMPDITRTIHVDIRYVLWVADAVSHADNVLKELGIEPTAR